MIRRRGEWNEWLSAVVVLIACLCLWAVFQVRVEGVLAAIDRREHQLGELAAWSRRVAHGVPGSAPDLAGLFGHGCEVMASSAPKGRWLTLRAVEVSR